jgi:thiosulfate/3-mercaptopyruvate sulfurtransferase
LEDDFSSPIDSNSGRHPLPDFDKLADKLGSWGINKDTQVIVYDDANGAYAVRMWWQLRSFGHNKVAVLDGGINQWIKEQRRLSTEVPEAPTAGRYDIHFDANTVVTTEQIQRNISDHTFTLLDARTPERFRGEEEPIDPIPGRVPGAINRAFQLNLNEDGLFLSPEELRQQYQPLVDKALNNKIVHMCGSGVTACHNMLSMEIAGFSNGKLYVGSWSEWIRDSKRPIATG